MSEIESTQDTEETRTCESVFVVTNSLDRRENCLCDDKERGEATKSELEIEQSVDSDDNCEYSADNSDTGKSVPPIDANSIQNEDSQSALKQELVCHEGDVTTINVDDVSDNMSSHRHSMKRKRVTIADCTVPAAKRKFIEKPGSSPRAAVAVEGMPDYAVAEGAIHLHLRHYNQLPEIPHDVTLAEDSGCVREKQEQIQLPVQRVAKPEFWDYAVAEGAIHLHLRHYHQSPEIPHDATLAENSGCVREKQAHIQLPVQRVAKRKRVRSCNDDDESEQVRCSKKARNEMI